jgi:hypothetical protein
MSPALGSGFVVVLGLMEKFPLPIAVVFQRSDSDMIFFSLLISFFDPRVEEATRLHEQSAEAGHEVWKGYFGIQAFHQVTS